MIRMDEKSISETYGRTVYTDDGNFFGKIQDAVVGKHSVHGWVVQITSESILKKTVPTVKAVIVPHKAVRAIGDVFLISGALDVPSPEPDSEAAKAKA
ncbi:MAG: hypothetical protein GOU99_01660 [Candidatus Altiarchaeota archaeon]|nr:hypothetical protein [Candidatus Altiarchaeota archaeon]